MKPRSLIPTEHQIQAAVVAWRDTMVRAWPILQLLYAIPNGAKLPFRRKLLPNGKVKRYSPEANKLIAEGLTKGIPDMHFAAPIIAMDGTGAFCTFFAGLYIEHKRPGEKVETGGDQERIIQKLREQTHLVVVSKDASFSIMVIQQYMELMRTSRSPEFAQILARLRTFNQGEEPWPRKTPQ